MGRRAVVPVLLVVLLLSAGCADIFGEQADPAESGGDGSQDGESPLFSNSTDTDRLLLGLSEVGPEYNLTGESVSDSDTAVVQDPNQRDFQFQHSRTFELSDVDQLGEKPFIIISSVIIYETPEEAEEGLENTVSGFQDGNASVSDVTVATGINATQVQFQADTGSRNVILYGRESNLIYFVITSGPDKYHSDNAQELYIEMYSDVT